MTGYIQCVGPQRKKKSLRSNPKMKLRSNIINSVGTLMTQIDTAVAYGSDATRGQGLTSGFAPSRGARVTI